ncbi:MAG: YhdP family protein [Alphaproteobacteria bacterium]
MIVRSTRIALEVVAGTLAVVVLLAMVALWRLSMEPVRLDFLTPHIEAALDELDSGFFVQIGHTELIWAGERRSIEFHTRDLRIRNRDGVAVAAFPDVVVRLSLRALVQGVIAPTVIEVVGARIRLARDADGSFAIVRQLAGDEAAQSGAEFSEVLPAIVRQLMSKPDVGQPLSFLSAVRIRRGQVTIDDRRLGLIWRAPVADIELRRDAAGLAGEVDLVLAVGDSQTRLSGDFLFPRGGERISMRGQFVGLQSEALIPLLPRLGPLAGLTMNFDGALRAVLGVDGRVVSVDFEVAGVNGHLAAPDNFSEPLDLRRIASRGRAIGAEQQIDIETLSIQWGTAERPGPEVLASLSLAATGPGFGGDLSVGAEVVVTGLKVSEFDRYWPVSLEPGREWVVRNIVGGHLDEVRVQTALHLPDGRLDQIELRRLDGTMSYHDLAVHYWRPMPPATGISGTAVFDHKSLTFTSRGGARLQELQVESGVVEIDGLDTGKETVKVDLNFGGPLRNGLELLDHDQLRLIRKLDIDPAGAEGRFTGDLKLRIPIFVRTTLDNIGVWGEAQLEQATIRRFLLGQDATEGQLSVTVDKAAMEVRGPLHIGGVPIEIVWNENFAEDAAIRSQLKARIPRIDDAGRKALGLDFSPYLEGTMAVDISYVSDSAKNGRLDASIDLRDAGLSLPQLYWSKAAGQRGTAELTLGLTALKLATIESFEVSAGTLRGSGRGRFDDSGKIFTSLALDDLAFDGTQLENVTVDWLGDGTAVYIGGGTIDAVPFLAGEDARKERPLEPREPAPAAAPSAPEPEAAASDPERPALPRKPEPEAAEPPPLREPRTEPYVFTPFALKAPRLKAIQFGPGRFIESAALDLRRGRDGWQRFSVEALLPRELWSPEPAPKEAGKEGPEETERRSEPATVDGQEPQQETIQVPAPDTVMRRLHMDYRPQDAGGYRFVFESNDMGAALRALGKFDTIHGGRIAIVGTSAGPVPNAPLEARIEARDYILIDAPAMVRLLTVASLTGINDSMKGEGIRFSRLIGAFTLTDGIMETELLRAFGPALGLTARGKIDFDESLVDLEGTAVPAYSVNQVLNLIPLLGPILTGGEGGGLFAVTYRMTGELDDPDVDVNVLSALAPGFLRALFSGSGTRGEGEGRPRALPDRDER